MEVKSYSARTLRDALQLVQREMGPDAAVLQTRRVWNGWLGGLLGQRRVEVTAASSTGASYSTAEPAVADDTIDQPPADLPFTNADWAAPIDSQQLGQPKGQTSPVLFQLFNELVEAELSEAAARQLVFEIQRSSPQCNNLVEARESARAVIRESMATCGAISVVPQQRRVVALVGPTGVGKTTTIAKLAATHRLRAKHRVGLITVDTYRIAAVEQLKTYAEIIELPMQVVSTPSEMRAAVAAFADFDLVLIDTAGRSPHDEIRIQELRAILAEAEADEVHLVLSVTSGTRALQRSVEKFSAAGIDALLLTKLDESPTLAEIWPVLRDSQIPVSYVTNGQNVPDDIEEACDEALTDAILSPLAAAAA